MGVFCLDVCVQFRTGHMCFWQLRAPESREEGGDEIIIISEEDWGGEFC